MPAPLIPLPPRFAKVAVLPAAGKLTVIGPLPLFTPLFPPIELPVMLSVPELRLTVEMVVPEVLLLLMLPPMFAGPPLTVKVEVTTAAAATAGFEFVNCPRVIPPLLKTPVAVVFGLLPPMVILPSAPVVVVVPAFSAPMVVEPETANVPV